MAERRLYLAKSEGSKAPPALPADAVTRTFGIFGVKDSGKTTTARTLTEGIVRLGGHVVILDPVGVWWGITRAGEGPGVPGIVIGGEHGDVPLEETGGQLVAELAVARQWPAVVIDLKLLRKGAAQRFMADFLESVYFANRRPLHVVFEEADRALPQNPRGMDPTLGRVLGAAEDIVKLGRSRGLGSTFISQRIATVTKNVVEQVEALILHAQPGPRDRKAVKEWVEANGDPRATAQVMDTMASLPRGTAWLYSPAWLGMLERIRVKMPKTLDSSSTPTNDEREREEAAPRAPVNLDELRERMAETVQRAEENDPRTLHKRIVELERQLDEREVETRVEQVRVPDPGLMAALTECVVSMEAAQGDFEDQLGMARAAVRDAADTAQRAVTPLGEWVLALKAVLDDAAALPRDGAGVHASRTTKHESRSTQYAVRSTSASSNGAGGVSGPEQRVLDALAWWDAIGVDAPERARVAFVAGYHERTKGYLNALGSLRSDGRIDYPRPGAVALTGAGSALATRPVDPPTRGELHELVYRQVGEARARLLRLVIAVAPRDVSRADLAESLGYHERTKGFLNALGKLRGLGLIDYPRPGMVAATDLMFPPARR